MGRTKPTGEVAGKKTEVESITRKNLLITEQYAWTVSGVTNGIKGDPG
jgi:hypothetical protein